MSDTSCSGTRAGLVFLDKPAGRTSFAALGAVKRAAGTRKVGHTGTLDPFATGLLIALVGPATRAARYFNGLAKRYRAIVVFGAATDTDDATGTTIGRYAFPPTGDVISELDRFRGTFDQLPPAYSAVHVDGRRAHEIARTGERPTLKARTVTVTGLEVVRVEEHDGRIAEMEIDLECSAGTYVRAIARDLGATTGGGAHLSSLRRTAVGPFSLETAVSPESLRIPDDLIDLGQALSAIPGISRLEISDEIALSVAVGRKLPLNALGDAAEIRARATTLALTRAGRTVAVGEAEGDSFRYHIVLPPETRS